MFIRIAAQTAIPAQTPGRRVGASAPTSSRPTRPSALYRLWLDDADLLARVSDVMPPQP